VAERRPYRKLDRSGRLVGPEHSSGYSVRMEPSAASRAFQFGANATGDLEAKCRACGSEATIEYIASPPTSKMLGIPSVLDRFEN
jgi:hypothetical protein